MINTETTNHLLTGAAGITLEPVPRPDITADFMLLAGSHMATTKVLARLCYAARQTLTSVRGGNYGGLLAAIEAAEKDLGLT